MALSRPQIAGFLAALLLAILLIVSGSIFYQLRARAPNQPPADEQEDARRESPDLALPGPIREDGDMRPRGPSSLGVQTLYDWVRSGLLEKSTRNGEDTG